MKRRLAAFSSPSFALISVLALVSLAALTATAFLASARLERQATRSLGETARLEMACTSASACASQTLNVMCQKSWQILPTYWRGTNATDWTNELGYLLIGYPNAANLEWAFTCGFNPAIHKKLDTTVFKIEGINTNPGSYLSEIGSFMATMTNGFVTNPTSTNTNCTLIPLLGGRTSPPVGWTYIYQDKKIANSTNTTNVPVARFSYYMEDLSGLIDAERMGGTNRTTGTNASEISLTNLTTNWSSNSIINASNYNQFINPTNRAKYFSPGMMLYAGGLSTNDLRYFAHGLLSWDSFPNTIPMGIAITNGKGYGNANTTTLKVNLNANLNVTAIAGAINANLPGFTNRAGGTNGAAYANNVAANIVDYVDTDPSPTTSGSTVGYDNYPLPVVFSDQIAWQTNSNPSNSTITVTTYLQLWNCSTLTSPAITYILKNNFQDQYLKANGTTLTNIFPPNSLINTLSVPALGPNQIIVLTTTNTNKVGTNASAPGIQITNGLCINSLNTQSGYATGTNLFELLLPNGTIISQHKGYYTRIGQRIPSGQKDFEGTVLTMSRSNTNVAPIGDPRMLRFMSNPPATPLEYRSSSSGNLKWGGYANFLNHPTAAAPWNGHPDNWPDGRKSTPATPSGTGQSGGASGSIPTNALWTPVTLSGTAPAILSTNGKFLTILELGNVFDPMQWKPPATFTANANYYNCSIDQTWTNVGAELHGGGTTLRIGRPEHRRFAFTNLGGTYPVPNMGQSAVALLDIFSVSDSYDNGGRINLNTAPAPVLRALAGGVILTNDSGMKPSSTLTIPETMTEAFAQGVMRFRAVNPFLTSSQLAFIATDYGITNPTTSHWTNTWPTNAVFGNIKASILLTNAPGNSLGTTASMGVSEWNDQATEEWFSKIYNLSTVQSWNYRTYVVAQLVNTNGLPTGPSMRKYSLIYVKYGGVFPINSSGPYVSFESPY